MQLINLLHSSKGQDLFRLLVYGIEGEHYTVNEDGTVTFANPNGRESADSTYGQSDWAVGSNPRIGKSSSSRLSWPRTLWPILWTASCLIPPR